MPVKGMYHTLLVEVGAMLEYKIYPKSAPKKFLVIAPKGGQAGRKDRHHFELVNGTTP